MKYNNLNTYGISDKNDLKHLISSMPQYLSNLTPLLTNMLGLQILTIKI